MEQAFLQHGFPYDKVIELRTKNPARAFQVAGKFDAVKLDDGDTSSPISEVRKSIGRKYEADKLKRKAEETTVTPKTEDKKKTFVTDSLSKLSRNERKLVSKILTIITDVAPKEIAEQIIDKIKEEMK